jgi:hypothetical protein
MKLKSTVAKFLTNKWVLKIVAFLALFNVIGYAVMGHINSALCFIVIAVLVRYFSKNMTIVLGIPLIIVNLLSMKTSMLEGMENKSSDKSSQNTKDKANSSDSKQNIINNLVQKNKKSDQKSSQGLPMHPLEKVEEDSDNAAQSTSGEQQGFESGRRKNRGYDIDYATTVEDAYDELNNILGSDGIQRLTSDTQNLMKQQMQLAKAMESMGPMMQSLAPMVENLKGMMGDGKEGLGGIMDLAKKFSGSAAQANK